MSVDPRERFPSAWQALVLVPALLVAEVACVMALSGLQRWFGGSRVEAEMLAVLLGTALVLWLLQRVKRLRWGELLHPSPHAVTGTLLLLALPLLALLPALLLSMSLLVDTVVWLVPQARDGQEMFARLLAGGPAVLLAAAVLAPLLEELLFRGIVLRSFLRQYPRGRAIGLSALLFGLAHLNLVQFVVGTLLGLLLGWLYERTRSVWPGVLLHAGYNSAALAAALAGAGGTAVSDSGDEISPWLLLGSLLLAGAAALPLWRWLEPGRAVLR